MRKKIELDGFLKQKYITELKTSPDEKNIALLVFQADMECNDYSAELWIYSVNDSRYRALIAFDPSKPFVWLDSDTILFAPKNKIYNSQSIGPLSQYCSIDIHSKDIEEYMRIPLDVTSLHPLDKERFLVTAVFDRSRPVLDNLTEEEKKQAISETKYDEDYEIVDEVPFRMNGAGYVHKKRNRMYLYDRKENSYAPLTDEYEDIYIADQRGSTVLYISTRFESKRDLTTSIHSCNCDTRQHECLLSNSAGLSAKSAFFWKDRVVVCGILNEPRHIYDKNDSFFTIEDGSIKPFAIHDFGLNDRVFSDHYCDETLELRMYDDALYFLGTEYDGSYVKRLTADGMIEKLSSNAGSVNCFELCEGRVYFAGYRKMRPQELYCIDGNNEYKLTAFHDEIVKDEIVVPHEHIYFENDGIPLEGYVLKPYGFESNKKYPGILNIHGGPKTIFADIYYHEMQHWAHEGYFVFFCNPRGSEGRGEEFADIRGRFGTIEYDDIMCFTDVVLKKYPQLDPDRLGVTGISYGGFMTNWIIGQTGRFRCAVSESGISSWFSMINGDLGYFLPEDFMGSSMWESPEKYWQHSPLKYAPQATTPTLFIHPREDYRCDMVESVQMYTALKSFDVETKLCIFRGENHDLGISGKPTNRIKRLREILAWFNKYLK